MTNAAKNSLVFEHETLCRVRDALNDLRNVKRLDGQHRELYTSEQEILTRAKDRITEIECILDIQG